ncbi:hypothetical protein Q5762_01800 [Streptomyces sp. P9(2023)]|uniref:hypothetical protein n=1 Tax=Streptomyces sp. P9(2023) TaxID=3064394 RepID=UPI0028F3FB4A|nr:hypothetical protein [Streptomyces sp. P9(2023)]MDT9687101.1 hypothetical protein [Streptomyces sp. P9(2023)]
MDVEQVIDELYGVEPGEFVAARDVRAGEARSAEDPAAAKRIAALRRPTLAAWASNRFVRERPEEAERLLALGATLQEAHRLLDPATFREASGQQHKVIAAEVRTTAALAEEAGHPLSASVQQEVEQLFRAVLADPEIAAEWSTARLSKPPEAPVGFGAITPEALPPRPESPEPPDRRAREAAKKAAEKAAAEAALRDEELRAAKTRADEADARVAHLEEELRQAKSDRKEARAAATRAATEAREAHAKADGA